MRVWQSSKNTMVMKPMLLRSDILVLLIRIGVSLPASHNPYDARNLLGWYA
jgi:hypothetical protein